MNYTEQAMADAVKGGYPEKKLPWCQECGEDIYKMLFDDALWKALGKTRGWIDENITIRYGAEVCDHDMFGEPETQSIQPYIRLPRKAGEPHKDEPEGVCEVCKWQIQSGLPKWAYERIACVSWGGDIENFFKSLV